MLVNVFICHLETPSIFIFKFICKLILFIESSRFHHLWLSQFEWNISQKCIQHGHKFAYLDVAYRTRLVGEEIKVEIARDINKLFKFKRTKYLIYITYTARTYTHIYPLSLHLLWCSAALSLSFPTIACIRVYGMRPCIFFCIT